MHKISPLIFTALLSISLPATWVNAKSTDHQEHKKKHHSKTAKHKSHSHHSANANANANAKIIRSVIENFNQAVSSNQTKKMLDAVAKDSVKIDLFKTHSYSKQTEPETIKSTDLRQRWQTVIPMLENTTAKYQRSVADIDIHVDKDMAVAWVTINTEMAPLSDASKIQKNTFTEVVLLKKVEDEWKIASLTNNRHD